MFDLNLTQEDREEYEAALSQTHRVRVTADILDFDERPLGPLTFPDSKVLSGSVNVNAEADITRSMRMSVLDEGHSLKFDDTNPADGALHADYFIAIKHGIFVETLEEWVDVPIFWGPVVRFERDGDIVDIEAQGKESLALAPHYFFRKNANARLNQKGTRKVEAIQTIMTEMGESRFSLPTATGSPFGERLKKNMSIGRQAEPWVVVKKKAEELDHAQLFYDGAGRLRLRVRPERPVYTFIAGEDGVVVSKPKVVYDISEVRNTIVVTGTDPEGPKKAPTGEAIAPKNHPLSPGQLSRYGVDRYMVEYVDTEARTKAKADSIANKILNERLREAVNISFDSLPVPHLEEGDLVAFKDTDGTYFEFNLKQFSIPLVSNSPMSVGTMKYVHAPRVSR
jgi:hypothetical protein